MRIRIVLLATIILVTQAYAATPWTQITNGKPVTLEQDKAYVLVRAIVPGSGLFGPPAGGLVFLRSLTADELNVAEARRDKNGRYTEESNVVIIDGSEPYVKNGDERTYVAAVKPGTYTILGRAGNSNAGPTMLTCLCMGTLEFQAKAGVVTDMGYMLWAEPGKTNIPELVGPMTAEKFTFGHAVITVRPYAEGMPIPPTLSNVQRVEADYRAVGNVPNYAREYVDRMVPVPGILDYDKNGRVVDLKADAARTRTPGSPN